MTSPFSDKENCLIEMKGYVTQTFSGGSFRVMLENNIEIMTHLSGKIRRNRIRVLRGDDVLIELSTYDLSRGRIIYRYRKDPPPELYTSAQKTAETKPAYRKPPYRKPAEQRRRGRGSKSTNGTTIIRQQKKAK